jgi:hypothetical protein
MTPHLKQRMIDVGRRARVLFAAISYAREGDRTLVDDLMAEVNAAWRRICQETEEMLEVYAYLLDQLEMHFRRKHGRRPDMRFRAEELLAFACTHQLELDGERYGES